MKSVNRIQISVFSSPGVSRVIGDEDRLTSGVPRACSPAKSSMLKPPI